ncbi:MAG TPA: hypothetical protein VEK07_00460 [Polyangiaceae bacterium]|nr:hypothetical protein [Polyangiaceae bacterium]
MSELRVFAQSADAPIDIDAWNAHAVRFFATGLGLADGPQTHTTPLDENFPAASCPSAEVDRLTLCARLVIAPQGAPAGIRSARRRARIAADLAQADAAEARSGTSGLARLARRCGGIWLVERQGPADTLALRLAAILASLLLGPILDPDANALFGVKTARAKMAG